MKITPRFVAAALLCAPILLGCSKSAAPIERNPAPAVEEVPAAPAPAPVPSAEKEALQTAERERAAALKKHAADMLVQARKAANQASKREDAERTKAIEKAEMRQMRDPASVKARAQAPSTPPSAADENKESSTVNEDKYRVQKIFFATDREKIAGVRGTLDYGIVQRDMTYGFCLVSVPENHEMGTVDAASIWKLEFKPSPQKNMTLLSAKNLNKEKFFAEIKQSVGKANKKSALIFIHGYNVSFRDAAIRTAQLAWDLGFPGAPILYSWPSAGGLSKYIHDEQNAERTKRNLEDFLVEVNRSSGADDLYIIGHSMGNRPLTRALADIAKRQIPMSGKIKALLLAAPDIDAGVFRSDIAPYLQEYSNRTTIYMSDNDKALMASNKIHKSARLGQTQGFESVDGIDMIDVTLIGTDFLGHSTYAQKPALLADINYIIKESLGPDRRMGLRRVMKGDKPTYWQFAKQK